MADNGSPNDPETNPFVAFRRFIDDEVKSVISVFSSLRPHLERSFEEIEKEHRSAWQRLGDSYERTTNPERTSIQPRTGEQTTDGSTWPKSTAPDTLPTLAALTSEKGNLLCDAASAAVQPEPVPAAPGFETSEVAQCPFDESRLAYWEHERSSNTYRPTSNFFRCSPYSPIRLEFAGDTRQWGYIWRAAFEDLMATVQDKRSHSLSDSTRSSPHWDTDEWLSHLQRIGLASRCVEVRKEVAERIVPGFEHAFEETIDPHSGIRRIFQDFPLDTRDELTQDPAYGSYDDHAEDYDDTYNDQDESYPSELQHALQVDWSSHEHGHPPRLNKQQSQSIIAHLTTVEKRTLADGSIVTRTVMKKRFADGTEQSQESTDVSRIPSERLLKSPSSPLRTALEEEKRKKGNEEKGGWFWSSS